MQPEIDEDVVDQTGERWLRCGHCIARVVPERATMRVDGRHEHEFMNPSGLRFAIACFDDAPGCVGEGPRFDVWTWFPGHAWQVEVCRSCGRHLGWSFHQGTNRFYALVRAWLL